MQGVSSLLSGRLASASQHSQVKAEAVPASKDAIGTAVVTDSWFMADISLKFRFVQSGLNFRFPQR
jgi:hypothetical protein